MCSAMRLYMRKSCWLSLGRVGSEGVGGVGAVEGSEGSVVAMLDVVVLGESGYWFVGFSGTLVLEKARFVEIQKKLRVEKCLNGRMMFIRSQSVQRRRSKRAMTMKGWESRR